MWTSVVSTALGVVVSLLTAIVNSAELLRAAKVTVARKVAATTLAMWKREGSTTRSGRASRSDAG